MSYDLNNNNDLIEFLRKILCDCELNKNDALIIRFFVLTRNYGLNNFDEYLYRIKQGENFNRIVLDAFINGFKKDNIEFTNKNLIAAIINNYHENGFYFHSFPGVYANNINEKGLLANNRNENDDKYYEIVKKYGFGKYFEDSENRICVTQRLVYFSVREYAIFTPEWLEYFLKIGYNDIHSVYENGNLDEIMRVTNISLENIKKIMETNSSYQESDFFTLKNYIDSVVYNRFKFGNNHIGLAFIPIKQSEEFFGEHLSVKEQNRLEEYFASRDFSQEEIINILSDVLVANQKTTNKSIPKKFFEIITYDIEKKEELNTKKH